MNRLDIAIIGAGPWGLAVLDRLVMTALAQPAQHWHVTLVDPQEPGPGVHTPDQPSHLLLNTVTAQIDSFSAAHFGEPALRGALSFLNWLHAARQMPADPEGFLPRALFGEYLRHVFAVLRDNAPRNLVVAQRQDTASDIALAANGRVRVSLASGTDLHADHVFVCTGHGLTGDQRVPFGPAPLPPYPAAALQARIEPGAAVGISGMGLVAVDVVASLTEGRGGTFERDAQGQLHYRSSGHEPVMFVYSRSGTPFACRPCKPLDSTGAYEPRVCTAAALLERRRARRGPLPLEDLLSMLASEMQLAYRARGGQDPSFDPMALLDPDAPPRHASAGDFSAAFEARLAFDVAEARKGEGASPYKYAVELLRVLRGFIRQAVEFDTMRPESRRRFFERISPRIAQLVVGPPVLRGEQWLALMRAGLLRVDLGPAPLVARDPARAVWRAQSRAFEGVHSVCLDHIVHGRALEPAMRRDARSLLSAMLRSGLCGATSGSEERLLPQLDALGHPIDATGRRVEAVTVLGAPAEGVRYFNHYLPSPKSRAAVFELAQAAIDGVVSAQEWPRVAVV